MRKGRTHRPVAGPQGPEGGLPLGGKVTFRFSFQVMGRRKVYASGKHRVRAFRARRKAEAAHRLDAPTPPVVALVDHADPVGALAAWASTTLIVPPGHPLSGEPMALPDFAVSWLRASWDAHESGAEHGSQERKISDCGGPGARLFGGTVAASWLAWRDCQYQTKSKAGGATAAGCEIAEASGLDVRIRRSRHIRA